MDFGVWAVGEADDDAAAGTQNAGELVEERDRIHGRDQVEAPSRERQRGRVGDFELDPAGELVREQPSRLRDHPGRDVDCDDMGSWIAPGERDCRNACPGAEIQHAGGRSRQGCERCLKGLEVAGRQPPFPDRRGQIEQPPEWSPEQPC